MKSNNSMGNFHGDDVQPSSPDDALFHIIPVPLEQSVTYGTGTGKGPQAIIDASCQLELLTCGVVPADHGLYTLPAVDCSVPCEAVLKAIEATVVQAIDCTSIPVVLGGEHTVTCGAIAAFAKRYPDFGVIQFDAHADLRDSYEDSIYNHACVMRRVHEKDIPILQLGTRSYCLEEQEYREEHAIPYLDSEEIWRSGANLKLPDDFPQRVYITFDIDAFDSSTLPATGTPVPGGLNWYQAMWLLEHIMKNRICIGFDVVELAPIKGLHASSFAAAQLTYNIMGYLVKSELNQEFWLNNKKSNKG